LKKGSSIPSVKSIKEPPSDPVRTSLGSYNTKSQPNTGGTSPRSFPIVLKFKLFKHPKTVGEIDKRGKESNPIPLACAGAGAIAAIDDKGRDDGASGDAMRNRFFFGNGPQGGEGRRPEEGPPPVFAIFVDFE